MISESFQTNTRRGVLMKNIDLRSILIGALGTTLFFVLLGADEAVVDEGNLGDIIVNSITIRDDGHGGCGRESDRADSCSAMPYRSWPADCKRRQKTPLLACA